MIHLSNECIFQHGPLDSFRAFPFESYLGQLNLLLRGTRNPLAQLKRRLSEIDHVGNDFQTASESTFNFPKSLKPQSNNDSFFMIDKHEILYVTVISYLNVTGILVLLNSTNLQVTSFYDEPLESSKLNVYVADNLFRELGDDREKTISLSKSNRNLVKCVFSLMAFDEGEN